MLDFDKLFIDNPELAAVWGNNSAYFVPEDKFETQQRWVTIMAIDLYESLFFQYTKGTLDKELWEGWENHIRNEFFSSQLARDMWSELKYDYSNSFQECMTILLKNDTKRC